MIIRPASIDDFVILYALGKQTSELRVSATEEFMQEDEFRMAITRDSAVFLCAEEKNKLMGFIYANARDKDKPLQQRYACLVYLVVHPNYRKRGVAQQLYLACEKILKEIGITNLYGWARISEEGMSPIREFMKKQGFQKGHQYVWMDKKIL